MRHIKRYRLFFILFIIQALIISPACERDVPSKLTSVDCFDCDPVKPSSGKLIVTLTINEENPYVPLIIYKGYIEDNLIEYIDTSYTSDYWLIVPVNNYYSISAEYKSGDKTIFAVDGDDFKLKYTETDCEVPCYYFYGGYYDLQLRN